MSIDMKQPEVKKFFGKIEISACSLTGEILPVEDSGDGTQAAPPDRRHSLLDELFGPGPVYLTDDALGLLIWFRDLVRENGLEPVRAALLAAFPPPKTP